MNGLQKFTFSDSDGRHAVQFAREAIETYTTEGQRMDVGSVDDLLNKRGGVIVQLSSTQGRGRIRGAAAIYDGRRIADALIDATIIAASPRSLGSEVRSSELDNIEFSIALIETVTLSDDPVNDIDVGTDCPIVINEDDGWLYPTFAAEQGWSSEEYLTRTCKKSNKPPDAWKDNTVLIAKTASYVEENPPSGPVVRDVA